MKTHKDRLDELRSKLEQVEALTLNELSAQVQALALCEIADEVIEWELLRLHIGNLVEYLTKYKTDQL